MKFIEPKMNISIFQRETVLTTSSQQDQVEEYLKNQGVEVGNTATTHMSSLKQIVDFN